MIVADCRLRDRRRLFGSSTAGGMVGPIVGGAVNGSEIVSASIPNSDRFERVVRRECSRSGSRGLSYVSVDSSRRCRWDLFIQSQVAIGHTRVRKSRGRAIISAMIFDEELA